MAVTSSSPSCSPRSRLIGVCVLSLLLLFVVETKPHETMPFVFSVWVLEDLVGELERQGRSPEDARSKVQGVMADMQVLTTELFRVS